MNKENFKHECSQQLTGYFQLLHKNKLDTGLKHRVQGFINAGEFLQVITRAEAIQLMDDAHLSVFGVTNEQRKVRKAAISALKKAVKNGNEDSIFEIPAIKRLVSR
ncbi:MAG: hypothetical protein HRT51_09535 [Colwellia sp.]|nr:hypothetical protein [Colwellia sp.]